MNCDEAAQLLNAGMDGEIEPQGAIALDAHLAECAACRDLREQLEVQDAALVRAFGDNRAAAASIADRVTRQLTRRPFVRWQWWGAAAAVLIAATLVATLASRSTTPPTAKVPTPEPVAQLTFATGSVFTCPSGGSNWEPLPPGGSVAAGARVRTDDAATCEIVTSAGATVRMNRQTEACFPEPRAVTVAAGQMWSAVPERAGDLLLVSGDTKISARARGPAIDAKLDVACMPAGPAVTSLGGQINVTGPEGSAAVERGQTLRVGAKPDPFLCVPTVDLYRTLCWQDDLLTRKPPGDPEVASRVKQLLATIRSESASGLPGPVEQDIRSRGQAWSAPMACVARSPDVPVEERRTAARLLSDLAPAWCAGDLIELLADADGQVRYHAATALRRLTRQSLGASPDDLAKAPHPETVVGWRKWWQLNRARYQPDIK